MNYLTPSEFLAANPGKIGRNLLYNELNAGVIPHIKVGRRILIPENAWDQMLDQALTSGLDRTLKLGSQDFDAAC
jgi:hypothetical protein